MQKAAYVLLGVILCKGIEYTFNLIKRKRKPPSIIRDGIAGLVGNTPMIELQYFSKMTGCSILAKIEYFTPGGCSKDRAALSMLKEAMKNGQGRTTVYEATTGSTGISLCTFARPLGLKCVIYMPSDICADKVQMLRLLGADVRLVEPLPFSDPRMYVHAARTAAEEDKDGLFIDQFENNVNWITHYNSTAPEIDHQVGNNLDFVVLGAGTAGTIAGISRYFAEKRKKRGKHVQVILADPQGSGLYNKVKHGVMFSSTESEGKRRRNQVDSLVEGIGVNRVTANLAAAMHEKGNIQDAISVTDQEAVDMSRLLLEKEGLFVGSSSAVNLVAAIKLAKENRNSTIVTLLCDNGARHVSKFWDDNYLKSIGIVPNPAYWENYLK